ncbi:MAG: ARMT1-like domain-containing protein [Ignisphaera sp.]
MKLYAECITCQLQVRYREIAMMFSSENERIEMMRKIVEELNKLTSFCINRNDPRCVPTYIATELFRIVKRSTGITDPYINSKIDAHRKLMDVYREAREFILRLGGFRDRILMALRFSLVGNMLDMGVVNYRPPEVDRLLKEAIELQIYGDVSRALELIEKAENVVMILDNAGEAVLDRLLAEVLRNKGKNVIAIIKGGAFQNDVSVNDVYYAELEKSFSSVIDTGSDASSIFLSDVKKEVVDAIWGADVIISKGMANYEYLTEVEHLIEKPIIYMFVAKCNPVSINSGVPLGKPAVIIHT